MKGEVWSGRDSQPNSPMRFRLRTLLIVLAFGPPLAAGVYWAVNEYRTQRILDELLELSDIHIEAF